MRILVINENLALLKVIQEALDKAGHEVLCTTNGLDAFKTIEDIMPDVVIIDFLISFVTGYELINHIRSIKSKYINIVVLSKISLDKVIENAFELGIDDYMFLPLRNRELLARVERLNKYHPVSH